VGNALGGKAAPCTYVFEESVKRVILIICVDLILASKDVNMIRSVSAKLRKASKMTDQYAIH